MTHDWNSIVAENAPYIIDCVNRSGIVDAAVVLADADEMRQSVPIYFARALDVTKQSKPFPLQSKQGHRIMLIPIGRAALEEILSDSAANLRPMAGKNGTLVLWVACLEADEFKLIDVHRAAPEHN